ncbi:hypothetical protein RFI_03569 [Reticulomyxa filosa]|uniref:Uncharacterized protein n=1 Tax=Reticulomyxa filosa TaxID=46433 RepID=X6P5Y5_RETFI|nr:hypothetical protein RFI_03569 [Reticulomyxa filosa]|eukprot:ETO33533.1 hypothetical protein RFI_03569 [Reticulomyxa filosa]
MTAQPIPNEGIQNLQQTIAKYKELRQQQTQERKELRDECLNSLTAMSNTVLLDVRNGVAQIYTNQKKIKDATTELQRASLQFTAKVQKWTKKYNVLNESLRQLGDVRNWAQGIRQDLVEINETLEAICEFQKNQKTQATSENASSPR